MISTGDGAARMVPMGVSALVDTEPTGRTALLAAGDLSAIVLVMASGMLRHNVDPLAVPVHTAMVIGPFVLGWAVAAPLLGAYSQPAVSSPRGLLATGANAWLIAALVGLDVRATFRFPGGVTGLFGFVVTGFGLLAVLGWRTVYAVAT